MGGLDKRPAELYHPTFSDIPPVNQALGCPRVGALLALVGLRIRAGF